MASNRSAQRRIITSEQVLAGYREGYFPMANGRYGEIDWYIANPRTIIPLDERFKVRRSLRQTMRKLNYSIRIDSAFPDVLRACARHDEIPDNEVWLSEEMINIYTNLHRRGIAHSLEVWADDGLVGGLYGIAIRRAFFGESMFTRVPSASQIALVALVERLRARGFALLDAQMRTRHIGFFGAIDLSHDEYLPLLAGAMVGECRFID